MKRVSLRSKFAVLFILVVTVALGAASVFSAVSQQRQAEKEMLEKAQVLAQETDAVWAFFETNQHQFKTDDQGNYELYCVIAAKSVSKFFTSETNYVIHYTNVTTRRASDAPDEFETEALQAFMADPTLKEYYGIADYEDKGTKVFRYMKPLYMGESCLECHGGPVGELDPFGYPKEGKRVGDIAGAVSIVMPIDMYQKDIENNIASNIFFYSCLLVLGFAIIFFGVSRLVTKPLEKLEDATGRIERGDFDIDVARIGDRDEIQRLARRINSMAARLKLSYEDLEGQVKERTSELARANEELERRREQLERANAVLQETNEYKSDFLATMSHELRTPLTSILAFTEIWENMDVERDEEERAAVHEVRESGQLLSYMVDNILEVARSEAGKTTLSIEPVDMIDLINAVEKPTGFLAQQRFINLTTRVDVDVPIIMADWDKLRRIVENLVSNAIKYTQCGGEVKVHVQNDEKRGGVVISVEDNGIGISEENLPFVFDRYTQIDKSSQKRYSGSGLGLAVVKELVELHGGEVWVESVYNQGSTFSVFVPSGDNSWCGDED
jgi:signal transduction histidine kinase